MNFERGIIIINILLLGMAANRDSINTTVFEELKYLHKIFPMLEKQ